MKKTFLLLLVSATLGLADDYRWQDSSETFWQGWNNRRLQDRYFNELDNQRYFEWMAHQHDRRGQRYNPPIIIIEDPEDE